MWITYESALRRAKREEAEMRMTTEQRAEKAFRDALTPEQLYAHLHQNRIEVVSNLGHTWIIHTNLSIGNVTQIVPGHPGRRYCTAFRYRIGMDDYPPLMDLFLAQALLLRTDENEFLRVASFIGTGE